MKKIVTLSALIFTLLIISCSTGSKVNMDNYDKISYGMTQEQCEEILGKGEINPTGQIGSLIETWRNGNNWIEIEFIESKVKSKDKKGL
jgi:hypothetical protein